MSIETLYAGPLEGIEPEDIKKARIEQDKLDINVPAVVQLVLSRYERAKTARFPTERRMLTAYEDYRGIVNISRNMRTDEVIIKWDITL